ncbi:Arc family DNA-binding protein [Tatumella ptyseos]|uniref:Arc family DNA-binding protein n=1 Tax=Tatumella ptyseos TaxID=82987 RepID=UPI0023F2DE9F|nr:Arc family DNA-binding protein [Tatumella ptyseos]
MSKFPSQEMDRFNVRLPAGMREIISERAKNNGRSMNSEFIAIIERAIIPSPKQMTTSEVLDLVNACVLDADMPGNEDQKTQLLSILLRQSEEIVKNIDQENSCLKEVLALIAKINNKDPR